MGTQKSRAPSDYLSLEQLATKLDLSRRQLWYIFKWKTNGKLLQYLLENGFCIASKGNTKKANRYIFHPDTDKIIIQWLLENSPKTFWQYFGDKAQEYLSKLNETKLSGCSRNSVTEPYSYVVTINVYLQCDSKIISLLRDLVNDLKSR